MANKIDTKETDEIRKALEAGKIIIGTEKTIKELKKDSLAKVFLSMNCPEDVREDLAHYSALVSTEVVELTVNNNELGIVCKKPFAVSILGLSK